MSRAEVDRGVVGSRERVGITAPNSLQTINGLGVNAQFGMRQPDATVGVEGGTPLISKNGVAINETITTTRILGPLLTANDKRVTIDPLAYQTHTMGAPMFMRVPSVKDQQRHALRDQTYTELYSVPMLNEVAADEVPGALDPDREELQAFVDDFYNQYRFDGLANIKSGNAVRAHKNSNLMTMSVVVHGPMETGDFYSGDPSGIAGLYVGVFVEECSYDTPAITHTGAAKKRRRGPQDVQMERQRTYRLKVEPFATSMHPLIYMGNEHKINLGGKPKPAPCRAWRIGTVMRPSNRISTAYGKSFHKRKQINEPYKRAWNNVNAFADLPKLVAIVQQIDPYLPLGDFQGPAET